MRKKVIFLSLSLIFLANSVFAGSATVSWNANTEPDLAGYNVYYSTTSRNGATVKPYSGATKVSVVGATTKTFSNLTDGATYYFSITAYDTSNNESSYSAEVSKIIPASVPACTAYTYSSWSGCSAGWQTRVISTKTPANCSGGLAPVLTQACVSACTSYTYKNWSACVNGSQTGEIDTMTPASCSGGVAPVLSRTCTDPTATTTPSVCTVFSYSAYSACSSQGYKTRTILSATPAGCTAGNPTLQESCTYVNTGSTGGGGGGSSASTCSSWTYGDWSTCVGGSRTRLPLTSMPSGCVGGSPILQEVCNGSATGTSASICTNWNYGNWSACANGKKTREFSSAIPANCSGGSPVLVENCSANNLASSTLGVVKGLTLVNSKKDDDGDGLSNDLETALGINSQKNDSDGDGYNDKQELLALYDPSGTGKIKIDDAFANKQKGKIFIQIESKGEAWYINPTDGKKYYLGRPKDAFDIMRKFSLGVNHNFVTANQSKAYAVKYRGKIILDVEDSGKAYYVDIRDGSAYYLGSPANAFEVIRKRGVGIKNNDATKIRLGLIE